MGKGLFILGTDTDVGKTIVTAGLVYNMNLSGLKTCSFKAASSGGSFDTDLVTSVSKLEKTFEMNPYCFKEAVSPHLAARLENKRIEREVLLSSYEKLASQYDYVVCEGSGGVVVPLVEGDYHIYDLVRDLDLDVVLVSKTGVGTINHTVLTVNYLKNLGIDVAGIVFNMYEGEFYEDDNIKIIEGLTGIKTISILEKLDDLSEDSIRSYFAEKFNPSQFVDIFK